MLRILTKKRKGKEQTRIRIGYTTHNGAEAVAGVASSFEVAKQAIDYGNKNAATNKERAALANAFLKGLKAGK